MSFKEFSPYAQEGNFGKHRYSEPACPGLPVLSHYKHANHKDAGGSNWRQLNQNQ